MTDLHERLARLSPEKQALLRARLAAARPEPLPDPPPLHPRPDDWLEPYPPTEVQEAYWIGRSGLYDLGAGGANSYMEYEFTNAGRPFLDRLEWAVQEFVERHDVLRTVRDSQGRQQVLTDVPPLRIARLDLRGKEPDEVERALSEARERLCFEPVDLTEWPLCHWLAHYLDDGRVRLQVRFDASLKDGGSRALLLAELQTLFNDPEVELEPVSLTYRDFAVWTRETADCALVERCRTYWQERIAEMPPPIALPLDLDVGPETVARLTNRDVPLLDGPGWRRLEEAATAMGLSTTGLVLGAFVEVLTAFAERPAFMLGIISLGRPEVHPEIERVFGNFNSLLPLACEPSAGTFEERARRLQRRLTSDLEHRHYSGFRVLRELNRRAASGQAPLPVIFNSVLNTGHGEAADEPVEETWGEPASDETGTSASAGAGNDEGEVDGEDGDEATTGVTMREIAGSVFTPQTLLMVTILGRNGQLESKWSVFEEAFPPGWVDALVGTWVRLLERFAGDGAEEMARADPLDLQLPAAPAPADAPAPAAPAADPLEEIAAALADALGGVPEGEEPVLGLAPAGSPLHTVGGQLAAALGGEWIDQGAADGASSGVAPVVVAPPERLERLLEECRARGTAMPRAVLTGDDEIPAGLPERLAAAGVGRVVVYHPLPEAGLGGPVARFEADGGGWSSGVLPAGLDLRVVDRSGRPRPDHVPGELEIGDGARRQRVHRLFRSLPDGRLELLGAPGDHRLQIQGRSVERRRMEAALEASPRVARAVVVDRDDPDDRRRAVAFVVPTPGAGDSGDAEGAFAAELGGWLRPRVPAYMVPSTLVPVERLPVTTAGRVDRRAMAERAAGLPAPAPAGRAPESELETALADLWEEVLGTAPESLDDDLFDCGATSLHLVRLQERIARDHGVERPLAEIFERPTLGRLVDLVERHRHTDRASSPWRRALGWLGERFRSAPLQGPGAPPPPKPTGTVLDRLSPGMRTFVLIWFGQFISRLGSGLGSFALGVWVFETTGSATLFAAMALVASIVAIALTPVAGLVADRFDRKRVMILADSGAASMTLLMSYLFFTDSMQPWMVYPIVGVIVGCSVFQGPALLASITLLVPRRDLARASGMGQAAGATAGILAPFGAGFLISVIGYAGVVMVDFFTFLVAAGVLLAVRVPMPPADAAIERDRNSSLWRQALFGWTYLRERPGLFNLVALFGINNFSLGMVTVLLPPMILSFAAVEQLGMVQGLTAASILAGSLLLSFWGGPERRIPILFVCMVFQGAVLLLAGLGPSIPLIAFAVALFSFVTPFVGGMSQAIWQTKVDLSVQGRVFAMRRLIATAATPVAYAVAGPLADQVFEPWLAQGGTLAGSVGEWVGVGPGRGVAFLFFCLGIVLVVTTVLFFVNPRLRRVEDELPDVVEEEPEELFAPAARTADRSG